MAVTVRPGDWICASCGNHNFASRDVCNKCGGPKGGGGCGCQPGMGMGAGMAPAMPAMPSMGMSAGMPGMGAPNMGMGGAHVQEGDWMCASCGNHNFASRQACNRCQAPKQQGVVCGADVRVGDWRCSACGNHNYASRQACNKCGASRTEEGVQFPASSAGTGNGVMRPGDWMCLSCNNHNFASRQECNKCGIPRVDGGAGGYGAAKANVKLAVSPYARNTFAGAYVTVAPGFQGNNASAMKEGDWVCTQCENHNYASRVKCNRCGTIREGFEEGDWVCRRCKTHNLADMDSCYKCEEPRR